MNTAENAAGAVPQGTKEQATPCRKQEQVTTRSQEKAESDGMSYLFGFASKHASFYVASVICAIVGVAASLVPYFATAQMVMGIINNVRDFSYYTVWIIIAALGFLLKIVFHNISTTISHRATFAVISEIRRAVTSKLQRTPLGYVINTPSGRLKNTVVEKIDSVESTLAHVIPEMTSSLIIPVGIIIYLFTVDWRMALISLLVYPIGAFCYAGMMKDYEVKWGEYTEANKHMNATAVEYANGIEVIKAFGQSASSYEKFSSAVQDASSYAVKWMKSIQTYSDVAYAIWPAALLTVLPAGCFFVMSGSLEPTAFVLIILLSLGIAQPLMHAMSFVDDLAKIGTITGDIAAVLNEPEQIRPIQHTELDNRDISLLDVRFSYGEKEILKGVSLELPAGTFTALVGPSGSGKSTLAKLIAGYWDVDEGSVSLGDHNIQTIPFDQLMDQFAYVSQDNYLFDESVMENIRMGNPEASDEKVVAIAKASGCHEFIESLEKGYATKVGSSGGHLSGGERQRIAIARAMLKDAPIVILDEATAYTDPENEAIIQQAVARLISGKTLIVIAHRLSTITDADHIVVVNDGCIEARGTHDVLLESCDLYRDMYQAHIDARDAA